MDGALKINLGMSFAILSVAMLVRYFALAGFMDFVCRKTKRAPLPSHASKNKNIKRDIYYSVISTLVFAFFGTVLLYLWSKGFTRIYYNVQDYGLFYFLLSLPLIMFLQDTYFYWTHRLLHHQVFFGRFHSAHHQSKIPTAWTSFAFHPVEALIQALILPLILIIVPVHFSIFITFLMVMTFFGVFNHLGYELLSPALEKKLGIITATHHHQHHQKVQKNFGLFFNWWDHLMRTENSH